LWCGLLVRGSGVRSYTRANPAAAGAAYPHRGLGAVAARALGINLSRDEPTGNLEDSPGAFGRGGI
jgi:hypothetical protein